MSVSGDSDEAIIKKFRNQYSAEEVLKFIPKKPVKEVVKNTAAKKKAKKKVQTDIED